MLAQYINIMQLRLQVKAYITWKKLLFHVILDPNLLSIDQSAFAGMNGDCRRLKFTLVAEKKVSKKYP